MRYEEKTRNKIEVKMRLVSHLGEIVNLFVLV